MPIVDDRKPITEGIAADFKKQHGVPPGQPYVDKNSWGYEVSGTLTEVLAWIQKHPELPRESDSTISIIIQAKGEPGIQAIADETPEETMK